MRIQDGYLAAVVPATGIYKATGGRLVLANCEVARNRAKQTSTTGHLLGGGGYFVSGSVLISNSVFRANGNSTKDAMRFCDGLAFYANNADVEVVGSLFESNRASYAWAQRSNLGGAIHCAGGTLRVADTRFVGNRGGSYDRTNMGGGGAVYLSGSCDARFSGCRFEDNESWNYPSASDYSLAPGGAIWAALSSVSTATFANCVFVNNRATERGGAIMLSSGNLLIQNCTLASNQAAIKGGALYVLNGGTVTIQNSILWSNAAADGASEIYLGSGAFSLTDSCLTGIGEDAVYGGVQMARVMTNNPLFASETDLHLKSTVARWDPAITNWTADAVDSPCIDAGDPALDYSRELPVNGGRLNLGAYGNTAEASKSPVAAAPRVEDRGASVSGNAATIGGELTDGSRSDITLWFGTNAVALDTQSSLVMYPPQDTGILFRATAAGLLSETTYYYAWSATNLAGGAWSATNTFVTGAEPPGGGVPIIHVDGDATGGETGANWTDAFKTVAQAIAAVEPGREEIWVAAGTYSHGTELRIETNLSLYGGFSGGETSRSQRSLANRPILSGNDAHRVIVITGTNVTLDGVIIRDGYLEGGTRASGLYKDTEGILVLANCDLIQNSVYQNANADVLGCGAYFASCRVTITNCTFRQNGQSGWISREALRRCCGIGFYASGADLVIADSRFYTNTVRSSTVFAPDGRGGAFYVKDGTLDVRNAIFAGNKGSYKRYSGVASGGGAGYLSGAVTAQFRNCLFRDNETWPDATYRGDGGALWIGASAASTVTVASCTFYGNTGDWYGGAVYAAGGALQVVDTILWANSAGVSGSEIYAKNADSVVGVAYSDLSETNAPHVVADAASLAWGDGILTADPLFASADDLHLQSKNGRWDPVLADWVKDAESSPCIDAGDPASSYANEPASNGKRINLGAYGNTAEASQSPFRAGSLLIIR